MVPVVVEGRLSLNRDPQASRKAALLRRKQAALLRRKQAEELRSKEAAPLREWQAASRFNGKRVQLGNGESEITCRMLRQKQLGSS